MSVATFPVRLSIVALALALAADPASACHHYQVWHYRTPQRCGAQPVMRIALPVRRAPRADSNVGFHDDPQDYTPLRQVPFIPGDVDSEPTRRIDPREEGIAKLRLLLAPSEMRIPQ